MSPVTRAAGVFTSSCELTLSCIARRRRGGLTGVGADSLALHLISRRPLCSYQEIKRRKQGGDPDVRLSATQHLLSAAEASTSRTSTLAYRAVARRVLALITNSTCPTLRRHHGHAHQSHLGRQDTDVLVVAKGPGSLSWSPPYVLQSVGVFSLSPSL